MMTEKYLIHELAEIAQTTVRTIRYYTDEGLLPQPEIHGKYAYYTSEHLRRLELIRQMKEAYLPLREIRQKLLNMNETEINQWQQTYASPRQVAEKTDEGIKISTEPGASAKAYIARLMGNQEGKAAAPSVPITTPAVSVPNAAKELPIQSPPPSYSIVENWQRIDLAPGVELHVQEPLDAEKDSRIRQLLRYAQKIFSSNI